jgi:hypothetical protein
VSADKLVLTRRVHTLLSQDSRYGKKGFRQKSNVAHGLAANQRAKAAARADSAALQAKFAFSHQKVANLAAVVEFQKPQSYLNLSMLTTPLLAIYRGISSAGSGLD